MTTMATGRVVEEGFDVAIAGVRTDLGFIPNLDARGVEVEVAPP